MATTGEIGPAHSKIEQGVATKSHTMPNQANATTAMTRSMEDGKLQIAYVYDITVFK